MGKLHCWCWEDETHRHLLILVHASCCTYRRNGGSHAMKQPMTQARMHESTPLQLGARAVQPA